MIKQRFIVRYFRILLLYFLFLCYQDRTLGNDNKEGEVSNREREENEGGRNSKREP